MTNETKHTPEAEALADAILKAAGSGLRHYSLPKTREAIFAAAQQGIDAARAELLAAAIEFVRKVESGEAKSKRSYAQFKAAIAKATSATPTGQAA